MGRWGMQRDTEIEAWEGRWSAVRPRGAPTSIPTGPFAMPFVRQVKVVVYVRRLHELFQKWRGKSKEGEGFHWLSLCCFDVPEDKFFLVRVAANWWRRLGVERQQRLNVKGCRFIGRKNLEMSAMSPCERDLYCQAVEPMWSESESFRASGVLVPVVLLNTTNRA